MLKKKRNMCKPLKKRLEKIFEIIGWNKLINWSVFDSCQKVADQVWIVIEKN